MALLIQNQAAFLSRLSETDRAHLQVERETAERFARIESQMAEVVRVLGEHSRILAERSRLLERLPKAVRDRIRFKAQP